MLSFITLDQLLINVIKMYSFHTSFFFFLLQLLFYLEVWHLGQTECGIIQDYRSGLPLYKV